MRISYTQLSTYQRCPQQYKLRFVDRIRVPADAKMHLGAALHETLKVMYDPRQARPATLEEVGGAFIRSWQTRAGEIPDENLWQSMFEQGMEALRRHYERRNRVSEGRRTAATELPFTVPFDGEHSLTGRIDRVDTLPGNELEVVDYKTGATMPPQRELEKDAQLAIYRMAADHLYPGAKVTTALLYLFHDFEMRIMMPEEVLGEKREEIRDAIVRIQVGDFDPRVGSQCDWCAHQVFCPLFRAPIVPAGLEIDIAALLREYVETDATVKQQERQLAELKQRLHEYLDVTQAERVQEGGLVAERRVTRRIAGFDEEKLRAALAPLGLWERVIEVRASGVREVLRSGQLTTAQRRSVEAAAEYTETKVLRVRRAEGPEETEE